MTVGARLCPDPVAEPAKPRLLRVLGPGLITGASDDDPSGIGTYSQAGAQFGFGVCWMLLFSYPLMVAIQEISARIGRTTGRGIAGNIAGHYPNWLLQGIVLVLFVANTINISADLGAMGDVTHMMVGPPRVVFILLFGVLCVVLQIFMRYRRYVSVLKWMTISLFAYFGTAIMIRIPWGEAAYGLFVPVTSLDRSYLTMLVAILGTTISPYLFFWQSSQEAEDQRVKPERDPLKRAPEQAPRALERIRLDTYVGMAFSNLVALAIVITTAATLHAKGLTDIQSSEQAAEALRPVAGDFAFTLFALGIVGTGLLAVPVLAGSAAYAVGEARKWPVGLGRQPREARAFYATIVVATLLGMLLNLTPINPIRMLYFSAVANGIASVPVMAVMMLMAGNGRIMGALTVAGALHWTGWAATVVMTISVAGMAASWFL